MRSSGGAAAALPGSVRMRWLVVVVAIMAILTAGWPLLNLLVSNNRMITANTRLVVGSNQKNASVTVGPGWAMQSAESNPHLDYSLRRGTVDLAIAYVSLINQAHAAQLWDGLRQLVLINHPGASLSSPKPITSTHDTEGDAGLITDQNLIGTAAVYDDPSRGYAVEMIVVAPRSTARVNLVAAQRIIRSLLFLPASR
jgi:hypothetical protein